MKVNMLEAKSQLSRLVKQALEGEDVIIEEPGSVQSDAITLVRRGSADRTITTRIELSASGQAA